MRKQQEQQYQNFFELSKNGDVEWILGTKTQDEDPEGYTGYFIKPKTYEVESKNPNQVWRADAYRNPGIQKSAVLIAINLEYFCVEENPTEEFGEVIESLRATFYEAYLLYRKASAAEIAKSLGCVCDILKQEMSEQTANFIISLFIKAGVPTLLVNHICWYIASHESGRLKPATFQFLIERSMKRYEIIKSGISIHSDAFENFDEALKFFLEKEPSLLLPKKTLEF